MDSEPLRAEAGSGGYKRKCVGVLFGPESKKKSKGHNLKKQKPNRVGEKLLPVTITSPL